MIDEAVERATSVSSRLHGATTVDREAEREEQQQQCPGCSASGPLAAEGFQDVCCQARMMQRIIVFQICAR
jgi:hypothetical protein